MNNSFFVGFIGLAVTSGHFIPRNHQEDNKLDSFKYDVESRDYLNIENSPIEKRSAVECISNCRNEYTLQLNNKNLDEQNRAAEKYIICFPKCFFPYPGNHVDARVCRRECREAYSSCILYANAVEYYTCILEKEKCDSDCSKI